MDILQQLLDTLAASLPNILAALGVLVGGWIVALILAGIVRGALRRTGVDERLSRALRGEEGEAARLETSRWVSRAVYYIVMLFVVVAFLQALNLTRVSEPIQALLTQIFAYLPALLGAAALLVAAWVVASVLRFAVRRVFKAVRLDERLASEAEVEAPGQTPFSETLANVLYWLVFLLFLPAILGALNLQGVLDPVQAMVNEILGIVPNIFAAGVILVVGWLAARIVRQIVVNLLAGVGVDRLGDRLGLATALGQQRLSGVLGTIVYVLVLLPVVIAALNALQIQAVTEPATAMLTQILQAIPAIFGAAVLIGVAYFVARIVGSFVTTVLTGLGFNNVLAWIGLRAQPGEGQRTPSEIVGYLATVAILLFGVIEAAELLGFTFMASLITQFLAFAANVVLGVIIFGLGLYLANLADRVVRATAGEQAAILAPAARLAIILFAGALALGQMGIGADIVRIAFGVIVGAFAVAVALAFGLGGRDIAARELERWLRSLRGGQGG